MAEAQPESAPGTGVRKSLVIVISLVLLLVGIGVGWAVNEALVAPRAPPASTIERIYRTGVMVVGTDAAFPPFESVNATSGVIEGFDIDLIKEIAAFMGVRADVRNTGWDPLFVQIPDRTLDVAISAMTITPQRNQSMLFSDPYFFSDLAIVIRANGPMTGVINGPPDLANRRVAAQRQTTGAAWINDTLIGQMGITPSQVRLTTLYTDAIALLSADQVDAVVIDKPVAEGYQGAGVVTLVYTIVTNEAFGIPMHLGELALKSVINAALKQIRDSGKYAQLIQKWFVA